MDEVVIDGDLGRTLTFIRFRRSEPAGRGCSYVAILALPEGTMSIEVDEWDVGPVGFFRELADSWRGFGGAKTYSSGEGQMSLTCTHDGVGTVQCLVTIGQPWPPEWSLTATLALGAAAHLERIALEAERFFG